LVDINEGLAEGKAIDMQESMPILRHPVSIQGFSDYAPTEGSDVVVITAGHQRKPGMSRDDLASLNASIVREAVERALPLSPNAIFIVLTNPVDVLTYLAYKISGLPKNRVIGQGGILDSARFRILLAQELGVSVESIHAYVLGGHGETMVPMLRYASVSGVPLLDLLPLDRIRNLVERARNRGTEILNLLKTSSACFAPGAALTEMIEAILHDSHRVMPCSVYLEGEFGLEDLYFGVPVQIGSQGVERIVEYPLNSEEIGALKFSAEKIRSVIQRLGLIPHPTPLPAG
jgi:malate dehydrogenase